MKWYKLKNDQDIAERKAWEWYEEATWYDWYL